MQDYVNSCIDCQQRARLVMKDRLHISMIPRDEIPFTHLYMGVIGPLFEKAEFNYYLCLIDSCTRFRLR